MATSARYRLSLRVVRVVSLWFSLLSSQISMAFPKDEGTGNGRMTEPRGNAESRKTVIKKKARKAEKWLKKRKRRTKILI